MNERLILEHDAETRGAMEMLKEGYAKKYAGETLIETAREILVRKLPEDMEGYESDCVKVTYKQTKPTVKTDWKKVAIAMQATEEVIAKHSEEQEGTWRFCVKFKDTN